MFYNKFYKIFFFIQLVTRSLGDDITKESIRNGRILELEPTGKPIQFPTTRPTGPTGIPTVPGTVLTGKPTSIPIKRCRSKRPTRLPTAGQPTSIPTVPVLLPGCLPVPVFLQQNLPVCLQQNLPVWSERGLGRRTEVSVVDGGLKTEAWDKRRR